VHRAVAHRADALSATGIRENCAVSHSHPARGFNPRASPILHYAIASLARHIRFRAGLLGPLWASACRWCDDRARDSDPASRPLGKMQPSVPPLGSFARSPNSVRLSWLSVFGRDGEREGQVLHEATWLASSERAGVTTTEESFNCRSLLPRAERLPTTGRAHQTVCGSRVVRCPESSVVPVALNGPWGTVKYRHHRVRPRVRSEASQRRSGLFPCH